MFARLTQSHRFQSTPARGGRHGGLIRPGAEKKFQSTPARGGRLLWGKIVMTDNVSIHARARRATYGRFFGHRIACFNPRPREAGDLWMVLILICFWFQSTPARGGRQRNRIDYPVDAAFQSTPARGGRPERDRNHQSCDQFQSTPARGGRPWLRDQLERVILFQSTPARGGRLALLF